MDAMTGYRFRPYDEELVGYYLPYKITGNTTFVEEAINEVNIYSFDPWNLPFQSRIKSRDPVWYFFSRVENNGNRKSRTTPSGFWKVTGAPVEVKDHRGLWCGSRGTIGYKRVLVFRNGKKSEQTKYDWVMHELHCTWLPEDIERTHVICRLEYKGDDSSILSAYATDPTNMSNSTCSVVDQSSQVNAESYNNCPQQPVQGNPGYCNHSVPEMLWDYVMPKESEFLVDERTYMQEFMQNSESMWKMAVDSVKKAPSTNGGWVILEEMSVRKSQWIYLKIMMIIGFLLFIFIIRWMIILGC